MTDLMAVISDLLEHEQADIRQWAKAILSGGEGRFSPRAAAFLSDELLLEALDAILRSDDRVLVLAVQAADFGNRKAGRPLYPFAHTPLALSPKRLWNVLSSWPCAVALFTAPTITL